MCSVILLLLFAGCRNQYIPVIPFPPDHDTGGNESKVPDLEDIPSQLDIENILKLATAGGRTDITAEVVSEETGLYSVMASRATSSEKTILVTFNKFSSGSIYIQSGTMTFKLDGSEDGNVFSSSAYTVVSSSLVISSEENSTDTITVSAANLKGDVTGIKIENETISSENIEVTPDPSSGEYSSGNETVSGAVSEGLFAGGNGKTEETAYIITDEEQFSNINLFTSEMKSGEYIYFKVTSSLDFSDQSVSPYIPVFRGEIDFSGNSLSGVSQQSLVATLSLNKTDITPIPSNFAEPWGLIGEIIEGKVSNLVYSPSDFLSIIYVAGNLLGDPAGSGNVEIDNITVPENTYNNLSNNDGNFIGNLNAGTKKLTFRNCVNKADLNGLSYESIFLGQIAKTASNPAVEFINCRNEGDLYTKNAALFISNAMGSAASVTITGCENTGVIAGSESSDLIVIMGTQKDAVKAVTTGAESVKGSENVITLQPPTYQASLTEDKVVTISNPEGYDSFTIRASIYANIVSSTGENNGTYGFYYSKTIATADLTDGNTGFYAYDFIDVSQITSGEKISTTDYDANIVTHNGTTYYVFDGSDKGTGINDDSIEISAGTSTSTIIIYGYENGVLKSSLQLSK